MNREASATAHPAQDPLEQRVIQVIAKEQRLREEDLSPESTFEELGFDSLDAVSISFALEEEFDITISDDDARNVRSVAEIVTNIRKLTADRAAE